MPISFAVLRFMPPQRVDGFLRGHLYMNPLEYFARLEGDAPRSDPNEGAHYAEQISKLSVQDERGNFVPIGGIINPIVSRPKEPSGINVFCLYVLSSPDGFPIDQNNFDFGESCVVLTDGQEFLNRVRNSPLPKGRKLHCDRVEYVERTTYDGPLGPFRKFDDHKYQQEFRLAVSGGDGSVFELEIGDIRDICDFGPTADINNRLRVNTAGKFKLARWHNVT